MGRFVVHEFRRLPYSAVEFSHLTEHPTTTYRGGTTPLTGDTRLGSKHPRQRNDSPERTQPTIPGHRQTLRTPGISPHREKLRTGTHLEQKRPHVRVLALRLLEAREVVLCEDEVALFPVPAADQCVLAVPDDALLQGGGVLRVLLYAWRHLRTKGDKVNDEVN